MREGGEQLVRTILRYRRCYSKVHVNESRGHCYWRCRSYRSADIAIGAWGVLVERKGVIAITPFSRKVITKVITNSLQKGLLQYGLLQQPPPKPGFGSVCTGRCMMLLRYANSMLRFVTIFPQK
jgi:hypothetical protein